MRRASTAATGSYVYSSPAVANGVVYVGSGDGNVYALGLANKGT
jgi:outer membrane protein assembly factor BamB